MPKETTQKYATYFLNKSVPIFDTKKCCFLFGIKKKYISSACICNYTVH